MFFCVLLAATMTLLANLTLIALNHEQVLHNDGCFQVGVCWLGGVHKASWLLLLTATLFLCLQNPITSQSLMLCRDMASMPAYTQ